MRGCNKSSTNDKSFVLLLNGPRTWRDFANGFAIPQNHAFNAGPRANAELRLLKSRPTFSLTGARTSACEARRGGPAKGGKSRPFKKGRPENLYAILARTTGTRSISYFTCSRISASAFRIASSIRPGSLPPAVAKNGCPPPPPWISLAASRTIAAAFRPR